jgi:hypothetical protein
MQKEVPWMMGMMALEATPFSAYCSIPFQPPVANVNQPKVPVTKEGYYYQYMCE